MNVIRDNGYNAANVPVLKKVEITPEMEEKIRSQIQNRQSLGATVEISSEGKQLSSGCVTGKQTLETTPNPSRALSYLERTGYEEIDNPIVDALKTVDGNVKDYVHNVIRQDFLRVGMAGITEEERQDLISLGMAEAQYVADNYMDEKTGKSFMQAMGRVAKIAAAGTADATGKLEYALPVNRGLIDTDGHTIETTDTIGMMRRYSPETYRQYQALQDEIKATGDKDKLLDSLRLVTKWLNDAVKKDPGLAQRYESSKPYESSEVQNAKVSDTFQKADTSDITNFSDSIRRLFAGSAGNSALYEHRLSTMAMMLQFSKGQVTPIIGSYQP